MKLKVLIECDCGAEDIVSVRQNSEARGTVDEDTLDITSSLEMSERFKIWMGNPESFELKCNSCNNEIEVNI